MIEKKIASQDHKEKYSSFKEKNSAHVRSTTEEPKQGNFEKYKSSNTQDSFERKKQAKCYNCSSKGHIRPNCPLLKQSEGVASINRIISVKYNGPMSPYTFIGEVNGFKMPIFRDTGSTIDIVCRNRIRPEMLTGKHIWIQQPIDEAPICLPLAGVELKGVFVNAEEIRAQKGITDQEKGTSQLENTDSEVIKNIETGLEDDTKVEALVSKHKECETLKHLLEELSCENADEASKGYKILPNGLLVKLHIDKMGAERQLLVIPKEYREELMTLYHEGTSGHVGITKTKDVSPDISIGLTAIKS
ncbi:hypothetical protein AVEN_219131-1 [Araneus ventricosus]|uniref:CCHC-type domain-containing protein n=1 Tax=Araneus ventricosus TaxID=182803 RepID=A0A4Y2FNC2_ARAVE|nr:hypothetical protein AVEN_219131-1 [Araneus ventricosus]